MRQGCGESGDQRREDWVEGIEGSGNRGWSNDNNDDSNSDGDGEGDGGGIASLPIY